MYQNIRITNSSPRTATIDIEGVIGVDENIQFREPEAKVATYEKFRAALEEIRKLKTHRVTVNIRSAGGNVNDALLIHDSLRSLDARITTRCYGYIASAATIIAQAASRGRREISSNSLYLIHNSVSSAEGNSNELSQTADLLNKTDTRIAAIYALRSGRNEEEFIRLMSENGGNGRWLSPEEALEMGLADRIIEAAPVSNAAAECVAGLSGLPELPDNAGPIEGGAKTLLGKALEAIGLGREKRVREASHGKEQGKTVTTPKNVQSDTVPAKINTAQLNAKATATQPKEDPEIAERKTSANRSAYEEDAINFR